MEEINNLESLIIELHKNPKCENKFINMSSNDFRDAIRTQVRSKSIEFNHCEFSFIPSDKEPQMGIDNNLKFNNCTFNTGLPINNFVFSSIYLSFFECIFKTNNEFLNNTQGSDTRYVFKIEFTGCNFNNFSFNFLKFLNNSNTAICFRFNENINENNFHYEDFIQLEITHFSYEVLKHIDFFRIESLKLNLSSEIDTFELEKSNLEYIRDYFIIRNFIFKESKIIGSFIPEKQQEIKSITSSNTVFKNTIDLKEYKVNELSFEDCTFEEKLLLVKCELNSFDFINCSFEKTIKIVDFYGEITKANFHRSTVKKFLFFNGFEEQSVNTTKDCQIDFSHVFIQPTGHIIIRKINNFDGPSGEINFSYANILGTITIQDSKFSKFNMEKSTIVGQFNKENVFVEEYSNRDTLVRIKNEFYKKNDKVKALEYKAKEFEQYLTEFDYPFIRRISKFFKQFINVNLKYIEAVVSVILLPLLIFMSILPFQFFSKTREYTLLFFNRISNSFGISWARGVIFTMTTALVFYLLIHLFGTDSQVFSMGWGSWNGFGEIWKEYLNILNVFNFNNQKDAIDLNAWGETFFFLSKIFIAFGVYQTIAAFRKYGK